MKVEITLKLIIDFNEKDVPLNDPALIDRIEEDLFSSLETDSAFQSTDDEDYEFTYDEIKVLKIK